MDRGSGLSSSSSDFFFFLGALSVCREAFSKHTQECEQFSLVCVLSSSLGVYGKVLPMGASIVKWTKQVLRYTKAMVFLVKGL